MIAAIHQPQYLPWLGYFDKMDRADVFCFLDNVQYKKNEWQNRNRIKTATGWQWITVPVKYRFPQRIGEVEIDHARAWPKKHLQALVTNYAKTPFFSQCMPLLERTLTGRWHFLSDLNICLVEGLQEMLGIEVRTVRASGMDLREDPTDRLIDICRSLGADTYLAGKGGGSYMDLTRFREQGVRVVFQDFVHPVYPQLFGPFTPHLSVVDLLFNCGSESIVRIRKENRRP